MDSTQSAVERERLEHASSDQIRENIRGTRREMDETLDHLGDRLHPRHLLEDVIDLFRGEGGGETRGRVAKTTRQLGRTFAREIKERPLPAMLVGAGIAWWLFDAMSSDEEDDVRSYRDDRDEAMRASAYADETSSGAYVPGSGYPVVSTTHAGDAPEKTGAGEPGMMERAKEKLAGAKDSIANAASGVGEKISGAMSAAGEKLTHAREAMSSKASAGMEYARGRGHDLRDRSSERAQAMRARASQAQERLREASDEHPLAVGGACLAAGLLAGLLLPRSAREDEWIGEASDQLKGEARAKGEEILERGKTVATQTAASAMDEAESRGITPGNIAEKAGKVISAAVQAGKETAKEEGLGTESLRETGESVVRRAKETVKTAGETGAGESRSTRPPTQP
jgi:ElaB/YqjD/DUF883 family membrane-anchored ribosome-binding protein